MQEERANTWKGKPLYTAEHCKMDGLTHAKQEVTEENHYVGALCKSDGKQAENMECCRKSRTKNRK